MLRELVDIALLEDFTRGLARASGLRISVYDADGAMLASSPPTTRFAQLTGLFIKQIPPTISWVRVPAHDPPGRIAYVSRHGVWSIVAPIFVEGQETGLVGIGEFRDEHPDDAFWQRLREVAPHEADELEPAWAELPLLDRGFQTHPVVTVRWGARMLADWCRRESRLLSATEEISLVGDIAELLTGERDLQTILDRIVAETARVMQCRFCSLRLYNAATQELTIKAVYNLSQEYIDKGAVLSDDGTIDKETLAGKVVYVEDVTTDPRVRYPDEARREGIVSILSCGLIYRGSPIGVIRLYTAHRRRFRRAQTNLLRAVANQAATAIVHARLIEARLEAAATERQLQVAGDIQKRMVRVPPPPHPKLQTASIFQPSSHLAGDFCDFFALSDRRLAAVVGDVAGKGMPASLLMASVRGALLASAEHSSDLGVIMQALNRHLCREALPAEFVTLMLVAVDEDARNLSYCNAGHEPLLLLRDGRISPTSQAGLVLGVHCSETYAQHTLALQPGDFCLLYTDGSIEAMNFDEELFGRQRLRQALCSYGHAEPEHALKNILWDVRRFAGLAEQSDDITLVGIRVCD